MSGIKNLLGTQRERFLGLSLILGLLLPHTSSIFLLINPFLCLIFIFFPKGRFFSTYALVPVLTILISTLINAAGSATGKSVLMALSIILCFVAFPMVYNIKLRNIYIYLCFGAIFLSQVCYMFNLSFISSFVDKYYPITWGENFILRTNENVTINNYLDFRLGGLYRNPNHLAKYVTFLLAIYLVNNTQKTFKQLFIFCALCFISIVFTGSRTGFTIGGLLLLFGMFRNQSSSYFLKIFISLAFLGLIIYFFVTGTGGRGMTVGEGLNDSAGVKLKMLEDYLSHETSFISYLFGHLDYSLFKASKETAYSLDSEYGYMIYCFGFIGFFSFIYFLWKVYHHIEKANRLFFVVLLWMLSSTIFMSYRAIFVFMLLLSTIYSSVANKMK